MIRSWDRFDLKTFKNQIIYDWNFHFESPVYSGQFLQQISFFSLSILFQILSIRWNCLNIMKRYYEYLANKF